MKGHIVKIKDEKQCQENEYRLALIEIKDWLETYAPVFHSVVCKWRATNTCSCGKDKLAIIFTKIEFLVNETSDVTPCIDAIE